jgi:hypothetical protein
MPGVLLLSMVFKQAYEFITNNNYIDGKHIEMIVYVANPCFLLLIIFVAEIIVITYCAYMKKDRKCARILVIDAIMCSWFYLRIVCEFIKFLS